MGREQSTVWSRRDSESEEGGSMHVLGIAQRLHPLPAGAACATMYHISKKMLLLAILLISLLYFFCWGSSLFKGHRMSNFSLLCKNSINCYVSVVNRWKLPQYNNYLNPSWLFPLTMLPLWNQITFIVQSCQHNDAFRDIYIRSYLLTEDLCRDMMRGIIWIAVIYLQKKKNLENCTDKENEEKQDYLHDLGSPCLKVCRPGKLGLWCRQQDIF